MMLFGKTLLRSALALSAFARHALRIQWVMIIARQVRNSILCSSTSDTLPPQPATMFTQYKTAHFPYFLQQPEKVSFLLAGKSQQ